MCRVIRGVDGPIKYCVFDTLCSAEKRSIGLMCQAFIFDRVLSICFTKSITGVSVLSLRI